MLALCLMLLGTYYTLPIMLALCLMLLGTYYAQNYAGIIGRSLVFCNCIPYFRGLKFRGLPNFPRKSNFRDKIFVDKLL